MSCHRIDGRSWRGCGPRRASNGSAWCRRARARCRRGGSGRWNGFRHDCGGCCGWRGCGGVNRGWRVHGLLLRRRLASAKHGGRGREKDEDSYEIGSCEKGVIRRSVFSGVGWCWPGPDQPATASVAYIVEYATEVVGPRMAALWVGSIAFGETRRAKSRGGSARRKQPSLTQDRS